jgi:transcription-repair coupling factor (superfamily II helicase)
LGGLLPLPPVGFLKAQEFLQLYTNDGLVKTLADRIRTSAPHATYVKNAAGSLDAALIASVFKLDPGASLVIAPDREEAAYLQNDLQNLLEPREVFLFPMSYRKPYDFDETENANVLMRAEVLNQFSTSPEPPVVVTYPEALSEKVITRRTLAANTFLIKVTEKLDVVFLEEFLHSYHFEKTDFVYEAGQFAVRGGIIDIFSFGHDLPCRIELSGNDVDSIRTFDPGSQLSVDELKQASIIPNVHSTLVNEERQSLLAFVPSNCLLWIKDRSHTESVVAQCFDKAVKKYGELSSEPAGVRVSLTPRELFVNGGELNEQLSSFARVEFVARASVRKDVFDMEGSLQGSFRKNFDTLVNDLRNHQDQGVSCFLAAEIPRQHDRLREIFAELDPTLRFHPLPFALRAGFIDRRLKVLVYTDHQIFERFHRYRFREKFSKSRALSLRELQSLQPGDFVTHIDYGIAKFAGLEKKEVNGRAQEAIRLVYRDDDILYVSLHSLHKISRYTGREGTPPVMSKLGSQEWENKKARVKKNVKDIAKELIQLYARRKQAPGHAFSADSFLQAELESSFLYEDTPDQARATEDVKRDMEQPHPMDRLVCGDVGFGKTEVAIRAAFKAVTDGRQVAVLVPTTLLAFQHHRTFTERMKGFPVKIDYLSRFRSDAAARETLDGVADGSVNIVIGTHRLVSPDVKFRNLGLLIVDEEQKFGVKTKEKLKELRISVDVLTLTATPIPRTLHFSLMGARDLSVISTPPPNRQPVVTELHVFDESLIRDAISAELRRGGQVFFVHNRVADIESVGNDIFRLVPDARIGIAHGQMEGSRLEKVMLRFIEGEYDVLVSTNIIESGLDIPNANTIIINQTHMFGLSDLHQMRGRVGRSNKKAYCYLLTPPGSALSSDARKRLVALEEFSELGDGFRVAMRDLDIRGAGNLLGAEQSGFINDLGFDTYHRILDEAVDELKESEFKELFAEELSQKALRLSRDCVIETDLELLIPESYVANTSERLQLYSRLDNIRDESELKAFRSELTDRFGPPPPPVLSLVETVRLRWKAEQLGFEKLTLKAEKLRGQCLSGRPDYFNSAVFGSILRFVQAHPRRSKVRDNAGRLDVVFDQVRSVDEAIWLLESVAASPAG